MGAEANLQDAESAWSLLLETIEDLVVALAERSCGQGSPAQPGQEE
jgi:hypothetical protein